MANPGSGGMETQLIEKIRNGDEEAFEELFRAWYPKLCLFARQYTGSMDLARDIVQEVFIRIWDRRDELDIHTSIKSYLYRAVKNQAISHLRKEKPETDLSEAAGLPAGSYVLDENHLFGNESFSNRIWKEVEGLPEKKRTVFTLYRKHGLSYKEIASVLGITRKTVENQMGRALHALREKLQAISYHPDE